MNSLNARTPAPWWAHYVLLAVLGIGGAVVVAKYPPARAVVLEVIAAAAQADGPVVAEPADAGTP